MGFLDTVKNLVQKPEPIVEDFGNARLLNAASEETDIINSESRSPFNFEFDLPYARGEEPLGRPSLDNRYPSEWAHEERITVLKRAHLVWERDPLAKGAIKLIRSFVVGTGQSLSYRSKESQEAIEPFINDPILKFDQFEKQIFDQLLVDGEIVLIMELQGEAGKVGNKLRLKPIKPWYLEDIITQEDDIQLIKSYLIREEKRGGSRTSSIPSAGDLKEVSAEDVLHVTINNLAYELRGRSDLFSILPWLRAYRDWLENRARINRYKGIIYHLTLKNATPDAVRQKQGQFNKPVRPASIYVSSSQEELKDIGGNVESGEVAEDGRQIRLMNAVGLNLPEYMLSEGQSANLATASAQQLPALKTFADYQDIFINMIWKPIYFKILESTYNDLDMMVQEIDANGKPVYEEDDPEDELANMMSLQNSTMGVPQPKPESSKKIKMIKLRDSFNIGLPTPEEKSPRDLADALSVAVDYGWVSNETASHRLGFDYRVEVKRGAKKKAEVPNGGIQGGSNGNQPRGVKRDGANSADTNRGGPGGNGYDPKKKMP